jgi:DNA-binding NarL/FixJ family response regulator
MLVSNLACVPSGLLRLAIGDDSALARESLRNLLEDEPRVHVIGEASSGAECIALCVRERPDVILLDIRMPDLDGIAVTGRLRELAPATRVIILTMFAHASLLAAAVRAGASGYLLKDTSRAELLDAIGRVVTGQCYIGRDLPQA